jgi:alcohol oxidase
MYTRGQAVDYDSFNTEGWSHKELAHLFRRFETFHPDTDKIDMSVHGMVHFLCAFVTFRGW